MKGHDFIRRGGFCEGARVYSSWRLLRRGTGLFVVEAFVKGHDFIRRGGFCERARVYSSWRLLRKGTSLFVVEAFAKGHDFSRAVKGRQFRGLQPLKRVPVAPQLPESRGALCAPAGGPSPPLRSAVVAMISRLKRSELKICVRR